jgi:hypothetical protein
MDWEEERGAQERRGERALGPPWGCWNLAFTLPPLSYHADSFQGRARCGGYGPEAVRLSLDIRPKAVRELLGMTLLCVAATTLAIRED